jgi:carbamate kinase
MRIVIALGGNALTVSDSDQPAEDQRAAVAVAAEPIADLVAQGHQVLVTHGNGPQVGDLLRRSELAAEQVPPDPLDWCGAQTQGTIGTMLMDALDVALGRRGRAERAATLVSRTLVDAGDPGFTDPTKPIGRHLSKEEAQPLIEHGQVFVEVPRKGWRRVVASPEPLESLDAAAADCLLAAGFVVVCAGGGGVPTVREQDGTLRGVEAVIDKDLTAAMVAEHVEADLLVIATDVEHVLTGFGTAQEAPVGQVGVDRMRQIAVQERFAAGSMRPKVEAVCRFAESTGGAGVVTSLHRIGDAVTGRTGTRVVGRDP